MWYFKDCKTSGITLHEIVACVASVYVWFRSEERLRNGIFVPPSFLRNRTETLATQANEIEENITENIE